MFTNLLKLLIFGNRQYLRQTGVTFILNQKGQANTYRKSWFFLQYFRDIILQFIVYLKLLF
jgi:hypothetical protein